MNQLIYPAILLIVGGLSGAVGVELIKAWRAKDKDALDLFYPTWKEEMARVHRELSDIRELVVALGEELTAMGGDPTRVRVELERQRRDRSNPERPT